LHGLDEIINASDDNLYDDSPIFDEEIDKGFFEVIVEVKCYSKHKDFYVIS
jgi:hypothetical protein